MRRAQPCFLPEGSLGFFHLPFTSAASYKRRLQKRSSRAPRRSRPSTAH